MNAILRFGIGVALLGAASGVYAQGAGADRLSTVTRSLDSRLPKPTVDLFRDQIKSSADVPWRSNPIALKGLTNLYIAKDQTEKVVDGRDVITLDPTRPKGIATPCDDNRPGWSLPNPEAQDFFDHHADLTQAIGAIISWNPTFGIWELVGSGALVRADTLLTVRHVVQAAAGLTPAQDATLREAWAVFNTNVKKFPDGIPSTYDPSKDADAIRIPPGSAAHLPTDVQLDLAFLSVAQQNRKQLTIESSALSPKTRLAVLGVPGRPGDEDATDLRADKVFSVCGQPESSWPVAIRIGTGAYLGADTDTRLVRFAVSTLGGDSGSGVIDAASGGVIGVTTGATYATKLTYNVGVSGAQISSLLATF